MFDATCTARDAAPRSRSGAARDARTGRRAAAARRDLGAVDVLEDAFVLCDGRPRSRRSGGCATCGAARRRASRSSTARGLCAVPGLVDCHTHPAWGGDRVDEFSLRAGGASYEELHAAGGGILSTVAATRALGEDGLRERVARHAGWMLRHGTTTWEGKSGYGLDRETELASLRAVAAAGGSPTWLGAHAVPPEASDADAYLDFALAEVLPDAARLADAADVFLERGAFDATQARRFLEACRAAGLALRLHGDQFTESGAIPLAVELGARSVDHLEATGASGRRRARRERGRRRAAAGERALPRPADAAGSRARRCRRRDRARDRLQPGQRIHDEPAARLLTRVHAASSLARRGTHRRDGQCRPRARRRGPRRADRARARARDLVLLDAPDWRYLAYHLAGDIVAVVVRDGQVAFRR